jgi:hypothetical protein
MNVECDAGVTRGNANMTVPLRCRRFVNTMQFFILFVFSIHFMHRKKSTMLS